MDDIRLLYRSAGHKREPTVFLFTESEIKDEVFLETINSILSTGEVPGLFAKDEMMAMTADLRQDFLRDRPGMEETQDNLKQYFTDCVRDNLHLMRLHVASQSQVPRKSQEVFQPRQCTDGRLVFAVARRCPRQRCQGRHSRL